VASERCSGGPPGPHRVSPGSKQPLVLLQPCRCCCLIALPWPHLYTAFCACTGSTFSKLMTVTATVVLSEAGAMTASGVFSSPSELEEILFRLMAANPKPYPNADPYLKP